MVKQTQKIPYLTREEVKEICIKDQEKGVPKSGLGVTVRSDFSEKLSGQILVLKFDDMKDLTYKFISGEEISWTDNKEEFKNEYAQILELEPAQDVFLINHLRSGTFPMINITLIVDIKTNLVTLIKAEVGDSRLPRDVERTFHFGYIKQEGDEVITEKHGFNTDLVGKIIEWHYDYEDSFIAKHFYMNNEHMAYYLMGKMKEVGLCEAAECDYIKIRDNVYLMSWVEKGNQGMQGVALMDSEAMRDVGSFFGIEITNELQSYTFAAWGFYSDIGKQII